MPNWGTKGDRDRRDLLLGLDPLPSRCGTRPTPFGLDWPHAGDRSNALDLDESIAQPMQPDDRVPTN
jgi:hypothetical protein